MISDKYHNSNLSNMNFSLKVSATGSIGPSYKDYNSPNDYKVLNVLKNASDRVEIHTILFYNFKTLLIHCVYKRFLMKNKIC